MAEDQAAAEKGDGSPEKPVETARDKPGQDGQKRTSEIEAFAARLSQEERMLILLKKELYDGSWQAMKTDLENRLTGKPYIFKLANRIRDDMDRIDKLQNFEDANKIDLSDFVKPPQT